VREIDTDALAAVMPSLGIGNPGTATRSAMFDDENLQQMLDINPLVRRARAIVPSEGIFLGNMSNSHAGAGELTETLDPYLPAADAQPPYPAALPDGFDVWICGVSGLITTDTLTVASLQLVYPASMTAFTAALGCSPMYAMFDGSASKGSGIRPCIANGDVSKVFQGRPLRLRRGAELRWRTVVTGAAEISANIIFAVLPSGLGQDVAL
jgi:hypothetical protein